MKEIRGSCGFRALALAAILSPVLLLASCSWLFGDPYANDSIAQRAEAWIDLDSAFADAGLPSLSYGLEIRNFPSPLGSTIGAVASGMDGGGNWQMWALFMDEGNLRVAWKINPLIPLGSDYIGQSGIDSSGYYRMSQTILNPTSGLVVKAIPVSNDAYSIADPTSSSNLTFNMSGTQMAARSWITAWDATLPSSTNVNIENGGMGSWSLVDVAWIVGTYPLKLVFSNGNETRYCGFASYSDLISASYLMGSTTPLSEYVTSLPSRDKFSQSAWLTAAGLVCAKQNNNGKLVLGLYSYTTGAELGSCEIPQNSDGRISFDQSGSFFLYYEKFSGRLYKLRTWW